MLLSSPNFPDKTVTSNVFILNPWPKIAVLCSAISALWLQLLTHSFRTVVESRWALVCIHPRV